MSDAQFVIYFFIYLIFLFVNIFTDHLPKSAKRYFCIEHIAPWCVNYEVPTYDCDCRYCRCLPKEWLEVKKTVQYVNLTNMITMIIIIYVNSLLIYIYIYIYI